MNNHRMALATVQPISRRIYLKGTRFSQITDICETRKTITLKRRIIVTNTDHVLAINIKKINKKEKFEHKVKVSYLLTFEWLPKQLY